MGKRTKIGFTGLILLLLTACSVEPEPIAYGTDSCHYCKMSIVDQKYGAEIVTTKGRYMKFDAIECMVNFIHSDFNMEDGKYFMVTHYTNPGELQQAGESVFLKSEQFNSPMGANLTAFSDAAKAKEATEGNAEVYSWEELLDPTNNLTKAISVH